MTAVPGKKRVVGWIGTGVMGRWMCQHLMDQGYPAVVSSRTRAKAEPLLTAGASWAESPAEVARQVDIVFTMVGFPKDVREVYLGDQGVLTGAQEGLIAVDMTTTEPRLAKEIETAAAPPWAFTRLMPPSRAVMWAPAMPSSPSWSVVILQSIRKSCRCWKSWASKSFTRDRQVLASIPRCATRSSLPAP